MSSPLVMAIVNVNGDSFHAASRAATVRAFNRRVEKLVAGGADIIDVGAVSSRPGAEVVDAEQEWARLRPVLESWRKKDFGASVRLSIDTFRPQVVQRAFDVVGDFLVNDISAGCWDGAMLPTVSSMGLEYVAMHLRGDFSTMHEQWCYGDVVAEVKEFFSLFALRAADAGIERWILDPGFGFSKSMEDNMMLMDSLAEFKAFGRPILVGVSRKRMARPRPGMTDEEIERETAALHRRAVAGGADILRVHDVPLLI